MTLLLAIRSAEGVVLASDGQSTTDSHCQPTSATFRKLRTLGGRFAWGSAGSIGLQQQLEQQLEAVSGQLVAAEDPQPLLTAAVIGVQQRAFEEFVALPGAQQPELSSLFCWCDAETGASRILSVPRAGAEHQLHERHAAVGTGEIFGEAAMSAAAHLEVESLAMEHLEVLAYKTVADAIRVAALFLGEPVQLCVVTPDGGAVERTALELEHGVARSVAAWESAQSNSLRALAPSRPSLVGALRALSETA